MNKCFYPAVLLALHLAGAALWAQDEAKESGFTNSRLKDKSAYRQKTSLGVISVGTFGINKDKRDQSTTGDIEVGNVFEIKEDRVIPYIFELETFFVSRVGTFENDESLFQSLGMGVGSQLNLRKQGQSDKWYLRFTAVQRSEYYMERYGVGSDRAVFELILGRNYAIAPLPDADPLRQRLPSYSLVATVHPSAFQSSAWSDINASAFLNDYLVAHHTQLRQAGVHTYADMNMFNFIIDRSGVTLSEHEARMLERYNNSQSIQAGWESTFKNLFRRALITLLRDKCMLMFQSTDAQALQVFSMLPDGVIQPDKPIDLDRMIETFLHDQWQKFQAPPALP